MSKITLFLGSSSAAKSQARLLVSALRSEKVDFLPWWDAFTPGRTLLGELDSIRNKVDGAVLLFSPEAESKVRGNLVQTPNLNVLFEFGYFYGHFGPERVAILKYGDFYLPSDLGGYIHISGSKSFKRSTAIKVGKRTVTEFNRWVSSANFESRVRVPAKPAPSSSLEVAAPSKPEQFERERDAVRFRLRRGYVQE